MRRGRDLWTAMRPQTRILYSLPSPHSGPRRAKRAEEMLETSQGLCRDVKGRALGWLALLLACVAVSVACRGGETPASEESAAKPARMPDATIRDLMVTVIDPAADGIWFAVKSETTREGTVIDTRPRNEEEWQNVRRAATTLLDGADLLMMPGRKVARPDEKSAAPGVELEPAEIEKNINADRTGWNMRAQALKDAHHGGLWARSTPATRKRCSTLATTSILPVRTATGISGTPNEQIPEFPSTPPKP